MPSATSIGTVESTVIFPDEVATFLQERQDEYRPALEKGLSDLGYVGEYCLLAGFNDELLRRDQEEPQVFLILDGDLKGCYDVISVSKTLAPTFSPYATVLYTTSAVYNLLDSTTLEYIIAIENCSEASTSDEELEESGHGSEGGDDKEDEPCRKGEGGEVIAIAELGTDGGGDEGGDDGQKRGKAKAKYPQKVPEHYWRRLRLQLESPLVLTLPCENGEGDEHIFRLCSGIDIELRDNKNGKEWLDLMEADEEDIRIATHYPPLDSLCSVRFDFISITQAKMSHHPSVITVHLAATPYHTECVQRFPPPGHFASSDTKCSHETRNKGGATATLGKKPEVKLELSHETADRGELSEALWSIHHMEIPMGDARVVEFDYFFNAPQFGDFQSKEIKPGPSVLFSQPLVRGTRRTLRIFTRILWKLPGTEEIGDKSGNLARIFGKIVSKPQPFIYANFLQKNSIEIDLEKVIQEGRDDIELTGGTHLRFDGDSLQDDGKTRGTVFQTLPIQTMQNGEECPIQVPIRRAIIAPIEGKVAHRLQEGKESVTSPDPDPFKG